MSQERFYSISSDAIQDPQNVYIHTSAHSYLASIKRIKIDSESKDFMDNFNIAFDAMLKEQLQREEKIKQILGTDIIETMQEAKDFIRSGKIHQTNSPEALLSEVDKAINNLKINLHGKFNASVKQNNSADKAFISGGNNQYVVKLSQDYDAYLSALETLFNTNGISADSPALLELKQKLSSGGRLKELQNKMKNGEMGMSAVAQSIVKHYGETQELVEALETIEPILLERMKEVFSKNPNVKVGLDVTAGAKGGKPDIIVTAYDVTNPEDIVKKLEIATSAKSTKIRDNQASAISLHDGPLKNVQQAIRSKVKYINNKKSGKETLLDPEVLKYYEYVINYVLANYFKLKKSGSRWNGGKLIKNKPVEGLKDPRQAYRKFRINVLRPYFGAFLSIFIGEDIAESDAKLGQIDIITFRNKVIWKSDFLKMLGDSGRNFLRHSSTTSASLYLKSDPINTTELIKFDEAKRQLANLYDNETNAGFYQAMSSMPQMKEIAEAYTNAIYIKFVAKYKPPRE